MGSRREREGRLLLGDGVEQEKALAILKFEYPKPLTFLVLVDIKLDVRVLLRLLRRENLSARALLQLWLHEISLLPVKLNSHKCTGQVVLGRKEVDQALERHVMSTRD